MCRTIVSHAFVTHSLASMAMTMSMDSDQNKQEVFLFISFFCFCIVYTLDVYDRSRFIKLILAQNKKNHLHLIHYTGKLSSLSLVTLPG